MKALILIAVIWAGFHYGAKAFNQTGTQAQLYTAQAQILDLSTSIRQAATSVSNPFETATTKPQTIIRLVVATDDSCAGMACYPDLPTPIPVVVATSI